MRTIRLAYRDNDRTPVIYCTKAMAERHYDLEVQVLQIEGREAFEAALFENVCDVIIEHIEYLYAEAMRGKKVTFFCAPQIRLKELDDEGFIDELIASLSSQHMR